VKLLVDAQLPARLADYLTIAGHDAIHTSVLPHGNRSSNRDVANRRRGRSSRGHQGQ
jgi:predicted nuclease of predicted toxin-antitoxin system